MVATDPDTGESEPQKVVATIVGHGEKNLVEVTVDVDGEAGDAVSTITATAEHPFWVDDHGRLLQPAAHGPWGEAPDRYEAADLDPGDQLRTPTGGKVRVTDVRAYTATTRVHNLTINGVHTYHVVVGGRAVLTHNDNCPRAFSKYEDVTDKGATAFNRKTDVGHEEFSENLVDSGWKREVVSEGKVVFKKDGDLYFLRNVAKSHEGWTADYKPSGHKRATLKIRLGG